MKRILLILVLSFMCSACGYRNDWMCDDKPVDVMTEREFEYCKALASKPEVKVINY